MLLVGCYLWSDKTWTNHGAFRYGPHHVRQLKDAVKRNLTVPHEFICVTDDPVQFEDDADIRAVQLDTTTHIPGREWAKWMTFHPNGKELFWGDSFLQMDLDAAVVGNMDHIVNRDEPLVVWRNPARVPWATYPMRPLYNGSIILHRLGTAARLWKLFVDNRDKIVGVMRDTQVLMSAALGHDAPYWDGKDGIFRLGRDDTPGSGLIGGPLPDTARIVFFPGSEHKPWLPKVRGAYPWIERVWPMEMAA